MASPQVEHGYTRIANELLEAVARLEINATQFRILTVVWRYTYGFSRKDHSLSANFIAKATGIHKNRVAPDLARLIERNVLTEVAPPTFSSPRVIAFNKDHDCWLSADPLTVSKTAHSTVSESAHSTVSESAYQERNKLKKKESPVFFTTDSEPFKAALYLKGKIAKNHPRQPMPPLESAPESKQAQAWARAMDLLHRLGPPGGKAGYSWPEIRQLIDTAADDPFWRDNILSAEKLREQAVRLEAKGRGARGAARQQAPALEHKKLGGVQTDETYTAAQH